MPWKGTDSLCSSLGHPKRENPDGEERVFPLTSSELKIPYAGVLHTALPKATQVGRVKRYESLQENCLQCEEPAVPEEESLLWTVPKAATSYTWVVAVKLEPCTLSGTVP